MSGDMSNAELGIAVVDSVGAKGRLSGDNGLDKQHSWSQNTMGERTLGYLFVLCVAVLGVVWMVDLSTIIRFGITGLIALGVAYWAISALRSKSKLKDYRNNQIKTHSLKSQPKV